MALIGWDAADWQVIHPLLDAGLMPNLQKLVERGVMGKIATLQPVLSPVLWTSIATGKTADAHGILGFLEPDPVGGVLRPVASTSRKSKALWNILHQAGLRSLVLNWFASHPAEPIHGAVITSAFSKPTRRLGEPWPLERGCIHPAEVTDALKELRVHPGELSGDDLLPFIPRLAEIDQEKDRRPVTLASYLADSITVHAAATWLMERQPWDFLAVYFDAIDHAGHAFMPFHPPRLEEVAEHDFELYKDVITGVYRYHDMMLGRMVELAGPDAVIMLVSDHGFQSGLSRPVLAPKTDRDAPLQWHRSHGIVCLAGPGIRKDDLIYGAGLLDVAPTILTLLGLPCGEDMPGRPLLGAFEEDARGTAASIERIPSWEAVPGDCGALPAASEQDVWEAAAVIAQLMDLGYLETVTDNAREALRSVEIDRSFRMAQVHIANRNPELAIPILEGLVGEKPAEMRFALSLAQCYQLLGRLAECNQVAQSLFEKNPGHPLVNLLRASVAVAEGQLEEGLAMLLELEKSGETKAALRFVIGQTYGRLNRWDDAERSFRSVLDSDADSAPAWAGLARCLLEKQEFEAAADAALEAIGLKFDLPGTHYVLGAALARLGRVDRAIQAFESCLKLSPQVAGAHQWLAAIHEQATGNLESAEFHRALAHQISASATLKVPHADSASAPS